MKQFLVLAAVLFFALFPALGVVQADNHQGGPLENCRSAKPECDNDLECKGNICSALLPQGPTSGGQILRIIEAIGDWMFAIFIGLAVIFILYALLDFLRGGGDPALIASARQKLIYAVIGIGLALVAGGLDNVLQNILLPSPWE